MNADALDINITPCYSFQVSNNKINFANDEYKGNTHQIEQPHWEAFRVERWWIHDADVVFPEELNFSWLHPLEKEK